MDFVRIDSCKILTNQEKYLDEMDQVSFVGVQLYCTFNYKVHRKKLVLISITVLELQDLKIFKLTSEVKGQFLLT